jgi:hypothetical protein
MICSLVRFHLSLADGKAWSIARSHLERCESCAQHQQSLERLDAGLRASGPLAPRPRAQSLPAIGSRGGVPALAALTCAIAVILLLLNLPTKSPSSATNEPTQVARVENVPQRPTAPSQIRRAPWNIPPVEVIRSRAPMQEELAALRQDGQRGLDAILAIGRK